MAAEILLSSEAFVKTVTSISDNVAGKYILPALREAQEVSLRGILGDALLDVLKARRKAGTLDGQYKALVDKAQYFLAYTAVVDIANMVTFKVANFGVVRSTDENLQAVTQDEVAKQMYYWQTKADAACLDLQNWVLDNRADFPELTDNRCRHIRANLYSAATCGVFLGGARGKGTWRTCR